VKNVVLRGTFTRPVVAERNVEKFARKLEHMRIIDRELSFTINLAFITRIPQLLLSSTMSLCICHP